MIEKRIEFRQSDDDVTVEKINPEASLEKVASNEISDEIQNYITKNIEKHPDYVYVLVCALGAGEVWGPNINADYFEMSEIKEHYKSFEEFGHVFTHHKNKDPKNSKGDILLSHWNDRMKRVELIVRLERTKAPNICNDIDNDKMWDVSMGCKVPYDVCSICGNVAKTTKDYCSHIEEHKNEVLPDGRKVYMINKNPRFFDISFVYIGADKTAKTLKKIASAEKRSSICKEIPGEAISTDAAKIAAAIMREFNKVKALEEPMSDSLLDNLSEFDFSDVLTTLLSTGITLKPREFQRLYLNNIGEDPEKFKDITINPDMDFPKSSVLDRFKPFDGKIRIEIVKKAPLEKRSGYKDYLYPRLIKMATQRPRREQRDERNRTSMADAMAVPAIVGGSALYKKYLDEVPMETAEGLDKKIKEKPWLLPVLGSGAVAAVRGSGAKRKQDHNFHEKTAGNLGGRIVAGVPAAYLASGVAKNFDSNNKLVNFVAKHPNMVAALGVGATNTKQDWNAIKNALEIPDGVLNKEAARMLEPDTEELLEQTMNLYDKHQKVDRFYDRVDNIGRKIINARNPKQFIGSEIDGLAGKALFKLF